MELGDDQSELEAYVDLVEDEAPGSVIRATRLLRGTAVFATTNDGDFPKKTALRTVQERFANRLLLRRLATQLMELALGFSNERATQADLAKDAEEEDAQRAASALSLIHI